MTETLSTEDKFAQIQLSIELAHEQLTHARDLAEEYALDPKMLRPIANAISYTLGASLSVSIARTAKVRS
jgi:hypothetical protein